MSQTSDELCHKWSDESGEPADYGAIVFLKARGWKDGGNGFWIIPGPNDEITLEEWSAIRFLIEEWDHAIVSE